jgi:hypothetical protein
MFILDQHTFGWVVASSLGEAELARPPRPLSKMLDKAQILQYNFTK